MSDVSSKGNCNGLEQWVVEPDSFTKHVNPQWDGHCASYSVELPSIDWAKIPSHFKLGVVFGPSGSGKTTLLHMLSKHANLPSQASRANAKTKFQEDLAVVSHPDFNGEALNRLSAVGLNKIPSWCRPYHVLSNGEQSRVRTALSLRDGAVLDDFAQVVDEAQANSMAASLVKLARSKGYKKVVVSSTKACVLPFLQPDFVVFTKSGKIVLNPFPEAERAPKLLWEFKISSFVKGGWQSREEDIDDGSAGSALPPGERLAGVVAQKPLRVSVKMDEYVAEACHAFDYEFTGESTSDINCVKFDRLLEHIPSFKLGAILGPSGSGKSQCLKDVGADIKDDFEWKREKSVISQLTKGSPMLAEELCAAVALPLSIAMRPFHVLSQGEQHRACLARQLDVSLDTSTHGCRAIGLDEFTSVLDRRLAKTVCLGINQFVKSHPTCKPIIVATVHQDIAKHLEAAWILDTDKGNMLKMPRRPEKHALRGLSFRLSQTEGEEDEVKQLLTPPVLKLIVKKLRSCTESRQVFDESFEQHHYMKGKVPTTLWALVARSEKDNALVAFHGISNQFGATMGSISTRESRLVVLPEFQGFGIGPKFSDAVGQILIDSGFTYYSVTHHPRLGGYREQSKLWKATAYNGKQISEGLSGKMAKARTSFRHMFIGTSEDGNRHLAEKEVAASTSLMKMKGRFVILPSARPNAKMLQEIRKLHGKTPREYHVQHVKHMPKVLQTRKRSWLKTLLASKKHVEVREVEDSELVLLQARLDALSVQDGVSIAESICASKEVSGLTMCCDTPGELEAEIPQELAELSELDAEIPQELAELSELDAEIPQELVELYPSKQPSAGSQPDTTFDVEEAHKGFEGLQKEPRSMKKTRPVSKTKVKSTIKKSRSPAPMSNTKVKKTMENSRATATAFPPNAILVRTAKEAKLAYIRERLAKVAGKTVAAACDGTVTFTRPNGVVCKYRRADVKYDVDRGLLICNGKSELDNGNSLDECLEFVGANEEDGISCAGG